MLDSLPKMNNEFGILKRSDEEKRAEEEKRRDAALNRRTKRELNRFYISGRINNFLKKSAENNRSVNDAINQIQERRQGAALPQITFLPTQKNEIEGNETEARDPKNFGTSTSVPAEGGGGSFITHPWKITLRTDEFDNIQFKVELNSKLYSSLTNWNSITISGLNTWTNASVGYILLSGTVSNGACTKASIQGPKSLPTNKTNFTNGSQTSFVTQLGYLYQDDGGNFLVRQNAFHNFTLFGLCINGNPAIYPVAV